MKWPLSSRKGSLVCLCSELRQSVRLQFWDKLLFCSYASCGFHMFTRRPIRGHRRAALSPHKIWTTKTFQGAKFSKWTCLRPWAILEFCSLKGCFCILPCNLWETCFPASHLSETGNPLTLIMPIPRVPHGPSCMRKRKDWCISLNELGQKNRECQSKYDSDIEKAFWVTSAPQIVGDSKSFRIWGG